MTERSRFLYVIETAATLPKKACAVNDNPISGGIGWDGPNAAPSIRSRSAARRDDSEMRQMGAQPIARHAERFGPRIGERDRFFRSIDCYNNR